jgi:hypothetical protein
MIFESTTLPIYKENRRTMKRILIFLLAATCSLLAQEAGNVVIQAAPFHMGGGMAFGAMGAPAAPIKGAPFTATITNESVQTLADGTHITHSSTGSTARDSQGRTRQDAPLPAIGNLAPPDAPHLVILQDPVAATSYTLNLTEKTAWKNPLPPPGPPGTFNVSTAAVSTNTVYVRTGDGPPPPPDMPPPPPEMFVQKHMIAADPSEVTTENLGNQTMEGVQVTGTRTTQTIAVGKIGNDRPIVITTEVWTSPELKTTVYSKRNDPRMGEQTFKLTNIQRGEPDASLFTVPSDFKITESGAKTIFYKTKQ